MSPGETAKFVLPGVVPGGAPGREPASPGVIVAGAVPPGPGRTGVFAFADDEALPGVMVRTWGADELGETDEPEGPGRTRLPPFAGVLVVCEEAGGVPGAIVLTCGVDEATLEGTDEPEGLGRTRLPRFVGALLAADGKTDLTAVLAGEVFATPAGPGLERRFGFVDEDPAVAGAVAGTCEVAELDGAVLEADVVCVGARAEATFGPVAEADPALDCEPFDIAPTFKGLAD